jgi:hypothetical protein
MDVNQLDPHAACAQAMTYPEALKLCTSLEEEDDWYYLPVWNGRGYVIKVSDENRNFLGYI